jgi:hypothetical protein
MEELVDVKSLEHMVYSSWIKAKEFVPIEEDKLQQDQVGAHVVGLINGFLTGKLTRVTPDRDMSFKDVREARIIADNAFLSSGMIIDGKWYDLTRKDMLGIAVVGYKIASKVSTYHFLNFMADNLDVYSDALQLTYTGLGIRSLKFQ